MTPHLSAIWPADDPVLMLANVRRKLAHAAERSRHEHSAWTVDTNQVLAWRQAERALVQIVAEEAVAEAMR